MSFIKLSPSRNVSIALIAAPLVIPAIYLAFLTYNISRSTKSSNGTRYPKGSLHRLVQRHGENQNIMPRKPASLPDGVRSEDSDWVLTYERVASVSVPLRSLALSHTSTLSCSPSPLLRAYTSGAHVAFASTPQAILIRTLVDTETKRTFETNWIQSLQFEPGDVVNGAYKVSYCGQGNETGSERIELMIRAPPSYKGPVPNGLILSEIVLIEGAPAGSLPGQSAGDDHIVFINETWMWRKESEKPTLVESRVSGWMHRLMAGWLIKKGISAVSL
ncbi:unnamed protein product [Clonostachys rosea f. rosea IK726]|uniref:Uncharacterized protein n=1 Tax=Clonostachys rosea f. rosea IK726 TaxID=1349383 RepID=A0ACA9TYZ0_BIOOC|nr:unnamed protein product [Clonostachys rosea f. rosea IK726]